MRLPRPVRLRSVLFHHVADEESTFTSGLGVRMGVDDFRTRLAHLARWYRPIALDDVQAAVRGDVELPRRAVLVTFDDAYASVATRAAPVLDELGVPSVFFVNGGFIDHAELGTDNLVAHVAAVGGPEALGRATAAFGDAVPSTVHGVLAGLVPTLPLTRLGELRAALEAQLDHDPLARAAEERLYLSAAQLRALPASMTVGSHTRSHVRCRVLDADGFVEQIAGNRDLLGTLGAGDVEGFSVPYGSAADYPPAVRDAVCSAGHRLAFLVEGRLNHGPLDPERLLRVSLGRTSSLGSFVELEVAPRLRYVRDLARGTA